MFKIFVLAALLACSLAQVEILQQNSEIHEDGSYNHQFQTSDGTSQQESGIGGQYASGQSSWYSPEGELIQLSYFADANGYQPQGEHLPTPPPIPEQIVRALEYIRNNPIPEYQQ